MITSEVIITLFFCGFIITPPLLAQNNATPTTAESEIEVQDFDGSLGSLEDQFAVLALNQPDLYAQIEEDYQAIRGRHETARIYLWGGVLIGGAAVGSSAAALLSNDNLSSRSRRDHILIASGGALTVAAGIILYYLKRPAPQEVQSLYDKYLEVNQDSPPPAAFNWNFRF